MSKRQKGKNLKRRKSWHRGRIEARRAIRALDQLPTTEPSTPPTGAPQPLRRSGRQDRGDTA